MNWDIEAPNVVTEARFRELVESGYCAEILCQEGTVALFSMCGQVWLFEVGHDAPFTVQTSPLSA